MSYREFQPHHSLRPYIDAYWVNKNDSGLPVSQRIYPDGCIEIIMNRGADFLTDSGSFIMKNEAVYLVGTMTRYKDIVQQACSFLLGIRFKPLGFPAFFTFSPLHEIAEKTVDFNKKMVPEIHHFNNHTISILDKFFCDRLSGCDLLLTQIMDSIKDRHGVVSIGDLAKQHFISDRKLERNFKQYLGISPKEYANFVRYQHATQLIKKKGSSINLLDVALDAGYYDHAHLTNEIKKYSGLLPSQLENVGFFQTVNI
jgi:AraC-like DNA-binding protein